MLCTTLRSFRTATKSPLSTAPVGRRLSAARGGYVAPAPWFRVQGWGCTLLSQGGQLPLAGLGSAALLDIGSVECVPQIPDPEHRSERE